MVRVICSSESRKDAYLNKTAKSIDHSKRRDFEQLFQSCIYKQDKINYKYHPIYKDSCGLFALFLNKSIYIRKRGKIG